MGPRSGADAVRAGGVGGPADGYRTLDPRPGPAARRRARRRCGPARPAQTTRSLAGTGKPVGQGGGRGPTCAAIASSWFELLS